MKESNVTRIHNGTTENARYDMDGRQAAVPDTATVFDLVPMFNPPNPSNIPSIRAHGRRVRGRNTGKAALLGGKLYNEYMKKIRTQVKNVTSPASAQYVASIEKIDASEISGLFASGEMRAASWTLLQKGRSAAGLTMVNSFPIVVGDSVAVGSVIASSQKRISDNPSLAVIGEHVLGLTSSGVMAASANMSIVAAWHAVVKMGLAPKVSFVHVRWHSEITRLEGGSLGLAAYASLLGMAVTAVLSGAVLMPDGEPILAQPDKIKEKKLGMRQAGYRLVFAYDPSINMAVDPLAYKVMAGIFVDKDGKPYDAIPLVNLGSLPAVAESPIKPRLSQPEGVRKERGAPSVAAVVEKEDVDADGYPYMLKAGTRDIFEETLTGISKESRRIYNLDPDKLTLRFSEETSTGRPRNRTRQRKRLANLIGDRERALARDLKILESGAKQAPIATAGLSDEDKANASRVAAALDTLIEENLERAKAMQLISGDGTRRLEALLQVIEEGFVGQARKAYTRLLNTYKALGEAIQSKKPVKKKTKQAIREPQTLMWSLPSTFETAQEEELGAEEGLLQEADKQIQLQATEALSSDQVTQLLRKFGE